MGLLVCGLNESNFYVGCVGYVGQNIIFTWVAWVKFFSVGCVGRKFLRGSNFSFFCLGPVLFSR